ncbi:hypothetical protein E5288_WYG015871 [Bos mutus]|uniref:Uncharacterized protein n=1 Tax=Bos mutus TaxID=72004 RepID=A0A6B0RJV9_9CETA|nr:hypothetical protein [Bos mutus]
MDENPALTIFERKEQLLQKSECKEQVCGDQSQGAVFLREFTLIRRESLHEDFLSDLLNSHKTEDPISDIAVMSKCKYEKLKGRGARKIEELMEKRKEKENYNLSAHQEGRNRTVCLDSPLPWRFTKFSYH